MSHTKEHLESFLKKKEKHKKNITSEIYHEILEIKQLDMHIREFSKKLDKDLKDDNSEALIHAANFEKEIHKELDGLFKITENDLNLYISILRNLNDYKEKIYNKTGSDKFGLTKIEMKYAKTNIDSIKDKLKNLKKIFKDLK
jgi:hypothetical protein